MTDCWAVAAQKPEHKQRLTEGGLDIYGIRCMKRCGALHEGMASMLLL